MSFKFSTNFLLPYVRKPAKYGGRGSIGLDATPTVLIHIGHPVQQCLVMKTGIPCAYILTRKTCFSQRENLLSLKRNPSYIAVKPFIKTAPCSTLQCMISYLEMGILITNSKRISPYYILLNPYFTRERQQWQCVVT